MQPKTLFSLHTYGSDCSIKRVNCLPQKKDQQTCIKLLCTTCPTPGSVLERKLVEQVEKSVSVSYLEINLQCNSLTVLKKEEMGVGILKMLGSNLYVDELAIELDSLMRNNKNW